MENNDVCDWSVYDMVMMPCGELWPYSEVVKLAEKYNERFPKKENDEDDREIDPAW